MGLSLIATILTLITNVVLFILIYKGIYIPNHKLLLILAVIFMVLYGIGRLVIKEQKHSKVSKAFILSISLYVPILLSTLAYNHWKLDAIISAHSITKIILILLTFVFLYLNFVYIRAEISYKRKRGNIRIQQEKQSIIERWRERKRNENEIVIQLGVSTESKDRTPPI